MTVFAWVGLIGALLGLGGVAVAAVVASITAARERTRNIARAEASRLIGKCVRASSWWFSEHPPTQFLLQEIAQQFLEQPRDFIDEGPIREKWREEMRKWANLGASSKKGETP